ncbi:Hypothetical predicted protein, partial [Pelobates cultripes]
MGGDLNTALDGHLDTTSSSQNYQSQTRTLIKNTLYEARLYDSWRAIHPTKKDYSFYSTASGTYSRIDTFLIQHRFLPLIHSACYGPITWSDHAALTLTLSIPTLPTQFTQWKLNDLILNDRGTLAKLRETASNYFKENTNLDTTPIMTWEAHKA